MAGILVLALKIWLECRTSSVIGAEVIDIAAWVFLWEAVDVSAFQNRALRFKRRRYLSELSDENRICSSRRRTGRFAIRFDPACGHEGQLE